MGCKPGLRAEGTGREVRSGVGRGRKGRAGVQCRRSPVRIIGYAICSWVRFLIVGLMAPSVRHFTPS